MDRSSNPPCPKCGSSSWTITKEIHRKSYSPVTPDGIYKWVVLEEKEMTPIVECAKCGNTDDPIGYTIKVDRKGKGHKVIFASNGFNKFFVV